MTLKPISYLHTTPVLQRGPDTPPFDPARPIQRFALAPGTSTYKAFHAGAIVDVPITPAHADKPNLPGLPVYPKWEVAPTEATQTGWTTGAQPVNPGTLATREQADQLARELTKAAGETVTAEEASFLPWFGINYRGDSRRMWQVKRGGWGANVGTLLAVQFASGVGSPGYWSWTDYNPAWIPQTLPDGTGAPELPHPCRELQRGERFVEQFGPTWMVEIADAGAATLENIYAAVRWIAMKLDKE